MIKLDVDFEVCECARCGIAYAVPQNWERTKRENHETFYCPNGHSQYFPQKTEAEKLRTQLNDERAKLANAQVELMAAEAQVTRLKKRAKAGVCPCCHRQFTQMARHMKSKHPDFT